MKRKLFLSGLLLSILSGMAFAQGSYTAISSDRKIEYDGSLGPRKITLPKDGKLITVNGKKYRGRGQTIIIPGKQQPALLLPRFDDSDRWYFTFDTKTSTALVFLPSDWHYYKIRDIEYIGGQTVEVKRRFAYESLTVIRLPKKL